MRSISALFMSIACAAAMPDAASAQPPLPEVPNYWRTHAERYDYARTPDAETTLRYARQLQSGCNMVDVRFFGTSPQGRPMPLIIVSADRAYTPEAARATGKPIILVLCAIHAGEIEGKDAALALIRDMAVLRWQGAVLDQVILLVVPMFSIDAHERRSPWNRIHQNGPEEMGWRYTSTGLNLNRDFMKAEAPEMQALLRNVFTQWRPHLLIDTHTTNGGDYRHDLLYDFSRGPVVPQAAERWGREVFERRIVPRFEAMGHLPGPYVAFREKHRPESGVDSDAFSARYSHGYSALQGVPGLLFETHMLKPYRERVKAVRDLLYAVIEDVATHPEDLKGAVAAAHADIVARMGARESIALSTTLGARVDTLTFKGYRATFTQSSITGAPVASYSDEPVDYTVPIRREVLPGITVTPPAGYFVPREWPRVREALDTHGVRYRVFRAAWSDSVDAVKLDAWWARSKPFEGHFPITVTRTSTVRRMKPFRPGDLWVPLDQPAALVAVHLLEAQSPEGLTYWNAFDSLLEVSEYAEDFVMAPIAEQMLNDDPALARRFRERLASDSTFAADPGARTRFFYEHSRWANPEAGLIPVMRARRAPPENVLEETR